MPLPMETLRHLLTVARTRSLMAPKTEPSRQVALARATKAKTSGEGRRRMTKKNPMICFRTINHAKHQWPECNLHEHCQYHITYHFFCLCISYIYITIYIGSCYPAWPRKFSVYCNVHFRLRTTSSMMRGAARQSRLDQPVAYCQPSAS